MPNQYPLEKRIKAILDRIHLTKDLVNRLEYEKTCTSSEPGCTSKIEKELPQLTDLPVDPSCLQKNEMPIIFILGGPGAGKGVQSEFLAKKYHLTHISLGELIRIEIQNETPLGLYVAPIVASGNLISTDTTLMLLKKAMLLRFLTTKGYLIDGFPATKEQAVRFERELTRAHLIIFLEVEEEVLLQRSVQRARADDDPETVKHRIRVFKENTVPLKYEFGKRCRTVLGNTGPYSVFGRVDDLVAKSLKHWGFTNENLAGDNVKAIFSAPGVRKIQGERKEHCYFNMAEVIGGTVPYYTRMDCTRAPLSFKGQSCEEEEK